MSLTLGTLALGALLAPAFSGPARAESFAVRTVRAEPDAVPRYLDCLRNHEQPRWRRLARNGDLTGVRVFRKTGERNDLPGPGWSVLTLLRARSLAAAERLARKQPGCEQLAGVELVRAEVMAITPGGDHPAPSGRRRRPDLAFLVEFIAVHDRPAALDEYRETMRASIGPAVGRLVQEDGHHSVLFLETLRVISPRARDFSWNQIHIRGFYPDPGPTVPAMTRYMEEADPSRGGFSAVFKRLDAIRAKPRDDEAQEVEDLAVPSDRSE
jgi:hypothetical protein